MDSDGEIEFNMMSSQQENIDCHKDFNIIRGQSFSNYFYDNENQNQNIKKDDIPTGRFQDAQDQSNNFQCQFSLKNVSNEGLFKPKKQRSKRYIQISKKTKEKYIISKKGNKRQTSLLNINLKTYLTLILKQYIFFNGVDKYQKMCIDNFISGKANFISFQKLYGLSQAEFYGIQQAQNLTIKKESDTIRRHILNKQSKSQFVFKVLENKKMIFENKIAMIKFLAQIRKGCISPEHFKSWKIQGLF